MTPISQLAARAVNQKYKSEAGARRAAEAQREATLAIEAQKKAKERAQFAAAAAQPRAKYEALMALQNLPQSQQVMDFLRRVYPTQGDIGVLLGAYRTN